jgi:hypothetical protein
MLDEASTNSPHPRNPVESACCIHRMAVIHWSNVGPDLGGTDAGGRRGEIGAALSPRIESGPDVLLFIASCYVRIRSTSCPEIGAFLFSALDVGGFSAARGKSAPLCLRCCG